MISQVNIIHDENHVQGESEKDSEIEGRHYSLVNTHTLIQLI